jgi:hypothetical protein
MTDYRTFHAAVDGGELHGGIWSDDHLGVPPVLAIHGITSDLDLPR